MRNAVNKDVLASLSVGDAQRGSDESKSLGMAMPRLLFDKFMSSMSCFFWASRICTAASLKRRLMGQRLRWKEHLAKVVGHHPLGAMLGGIDTHDGESLASDLLHARSNDAAGLLHILSLPRIRLKMSLTTIVIIGPEFSAHADLRTGKDAPGYLFTQRQSKLATL
jgi:hypothetical protein